MFQNRNAVIGVALAAALCVAQTPAVAQFRGGPMNIGPRGSMPTMMSTPRLDPGFRTTPNYGSSNYGGDSGVSSGTAPKSSRKVQSASPKKDGGGDRATGGGGQTTRAARRSNAPPSGEQRYIKDEVVVEVAGTLSDTSADAMARRYRLTRLESTPVGLTNTTWFRWRIPDGRSVTQVVRALEGDGSVRTAQPNYLYAAQQSPQTSGVAPAQSTARQDGIAAQEGDPAQYAVEKLHLTQAHGLARGNDVSVAVIDSGIDVTHPELAGVIGGTFDAVGSSDGPHFHGTGIAGIIAARAKLVGAAPNVRILAIRAFSSTEGSTFTILKSLDYAAAQKARVINMSFAGPSDPALSRALAAARQRGAVLVAAAGNAGPKSPPLFPAADPNVIAVSATDVDDKVFAQANRGSYVTLSAPGVDILMPIPGDAYKMSSGTSMAAAYVSGIAALILERAPKLDPDGVKRILVATARDLGAKGRDDQFGAGLTDAFRAITAADQGAKAANEVLVAAPPGR